MFKCPCHEQYNIVVGESNTLVNCNETKFLYFVFPNEHETKWNEIEMIGHEIWRRNAVIKKFELNFVVFIVLFYFVIYIYLHRRSGAKSAKRCDHVWRKNELNFIFQFRKWEHFTQWTIVVSISLWLSGFFFLGEIHFGSSSPTIRNFSSFLWEFKRRKCFVTNQKPSNRKWLTRDPRTVAFNRSSKTNEQLFQSRAAATTYHNRFVWRRLIRHILFMSKASLVFEIELNRR